VSVSAKNLPFPATNDSFDIRFPRSDDPLDQDEEWFEFTIDGERRKLRIHDYDELFNIPGLYEALVYDELECQSPVELAGLFTQVFDRDGADANTLRVLDLGAGNGIVAEELKKIGAGHLVGLDLLPEAKLAALRDRPGLYDDYLVADLCELEEADRIRMDDHRLNCLVTVAALGFGDIPPAAFITALNLLSWEGWVGFTIKEDFLQEADPSGFAKLIKTLVDSNVLSVEATKRYRHRLSITGEPLHYVAIVARKRSDAPLDVLEEIDDDGPPPAA